MRKVVLATTLTLLLAGCTAIEDTEKKVDNAIENGGAYSKEIIVDQKEENKVDGAEEIKEDKEPNSSLSDEGTEVATSEKKEILKVLSTYKMVVETIDFDSSINLISGKTHLLGGYVESSHKEDEYGGKTSKITLKIPKTKAKEMEDFLHENENLRITEETLESVDAAERAYDVESRLNNTIEREKRLLELYETAENVEDILLIEEKLFSIIKEKEELKAQKEKLNDRLLFSKIEMELKEVKSFPKEDGEESEVKKAFSKSFNLIGNAISDLIILFAKMLPLFAIFSVLSLFSIPFFIKKIKSKMKQKNSREENNGEEEETDSSNAKENEGEDNKSNGTEEK